MDRIDDFNDYEQKGRVAISALDDAVQECHKGLDRVTITAVSFAIPCIINKDLSELRAIDLAVSMFKQVYKAGYLAGRNDLATTIQSGVNQG